MDVAQSGGTVGPGTLINGGTFNYTGGLFTGRLVNDGTFLFSTSFFAGGGIENDVTLTVPALFALGTTGASSTLDNEGTFILAGGSLVGGSSPGNGGPIVNNGLITGYGVLSSGVGITNNGQIAPSGGVLVIAGASTASNLGTMSLASGYQLRLSGSTLANLGTLNLDSSTVAGSGLLNNSGGNIAGPGTITVPFVNSSGILSVPQGTMNITQPFQNSGSIQLSGFTADLTGGSIANSGSIQGNGLVTSAVNNTGTIESIDGTLTFSGSLLNAPGGFVTTDAGSKLLVSSGLAANLGTINLTGGIFDNNSFALSNSGQISGYGILRTGGLTNHGTIDLTGATSTVNGPVTNASGGSISIAYNPAIFTGAVTNNGYVKITSTTATWAGGFTNNGTYISDPAVSYFSDLAVGPSGLLQGGVSDKFVVTGPLLSNAGQIDLGGTSVMAVENGAGLLANRRHVGNRHGRHIVGGLNRDCRRDAAGRRPGRHYHGQFGLRQFLAEHLSGRSRRRRQYAHRRQPGRRSRLERQRQFLFRRHVRHGRGVGRYQPRRNRKRYRLGRRKRPRRVWHGRARR